jgi:hypothetical protein
MTPPRAASPAASVGRLVAVAVGLVWLTWPLARRMTTHLPDTYLTCRFDGILPIWALVWETRTLLGAPWRILEANAYHPTPHALAYGNMGFGALPLFAPVFLVSGNPVLALNATFLAGVALTAWGCGEVTARLTRSHAAAVVAAATFLTTPFVFWSWVPTAPFYAALVYMPWILLLAAGRLDRPHHVAILGALIGLQCATDPVYVAPGVLLTVAAVAAVRLRRPPTRPAGRRLAQALVVGVALVGPIVAAHGMIRLGDPSFSARSVWNIAAQTNRDALRPYLVGGVPQSPLDIPWWSRGNGGPLGIPHASLLLLAVGAIVARGRRLPLGVRRAWMHGMLWTIVAVVISVPSVRLAGRVVIPSPLWVAAGRWATSLAETVRWTPRLGAGGLVGASVAAGAAFATLLGALRDRGHGRRMTGAFTVAALALVCLERSPLVARGPYPTRLAPDGTDPMTRMLRAGTGPLLEIPAPDAGLAVIPQAAAMYRSIHHRRPVLNGYASYFPAGFRERMALAERLPDPDAVGALEADTGLTQILVHDGPGLPQAAAWRAIADGARHPRLRLAARTPAELLFDVVPSAAASRGATPIP